MGRKDMEILSQLFEGNHLSDSELFRADKLLGLLTIELGNRCKSDKDIGSQLAEKSWEGVR